MVTESSQIADEPGDNCETIRVMLVDDHEAMREGLRHMLSGDVGIKVVGEARNGKEALTKAKRLSPNIILMDVRMPGIDGIEATRCLKEAQPPVGVIMLAENRKYLAPAIKAGAVGFLTRNISSSDLIAAIRIIHLWRLGLFRNGGSGFALVKL